jgi:hypothetical protein
MSYEEKCKVLGLRTLECRRWEIDMVQTFKIMRGYGKIRHEVFFEKYGVRETARTRIAAGLENLVIPRFRSEILSTRGEKLEQATGRRKTGTDTDRV